MTDWYAPNQQAVRGDESGPAEEGEGGTERVDPEPVEREQDESEQAETDQRDLDEMTKAELIEEADRRGVDVDPSATKAEIREALEA